jgi:branched-chain amino acid transport system ATP-binding protein
MLEVAQIDVYYADFQALQGISIDLSQREIVTLLGSNGSGKSTLLKAISGLLKTRTGAITYEGIRIDKKSPHEIVRLGVSMVPEGRRLWPEMSVLENLEVGAYHRTARRAKDESLNWIYEVFPVIKERATQAAGTLSGGEQQMLAIGRALMSRPKLLLIDEMSLGLAPIIMKECARVIKRLNKTNSLTILLVEQNVKLALNIANRGYILENGFVVGKGDAKELLGSERVINAYLGVERGV